MGLTRSAPADPWAAAALVHRAALLHRSGRSLALRQVLGSVTLGWSDEAGLVAVIGVFPVGAGGECWLAGDAQRARPHLKQIAREARLTLAALAENGVTPIVAHVMPGHAPGARLARLAGFRRARPANGLERFQFGG